MKLILLGAPGAGKVLKPTTSMKGSVSRKSQPGICCAPQSRQGLHVRLLLLLVLDHVVQDRWEDDFHRVAHLAARHDQRIRA